MTKLKSSDYKNYSKFINNLAGKLTKFYYSKLNKSFKVNNKLKGRGYDPVTTADKSFEKFIRYKIQKKFPKHEIIGEEFGQKKTKSEDFKFDGGIIEFVEFLDEKRLKLKNKNDNDLFKKHIF